MINVAIIIGSTRPGRKAEAIAAWVFQNAIKRSDARFEILDIESFALPLFDEALPPFMGRYAQDHTVAWSKAISQFDAFVFIAPEYNHGPSAALKNAIDYLFKEWNDKVAGFVGYGASGGTRVVEQLRLVMAELRVATVRAQVRLSLYQDFEKFTQFKPRSDHSKDLATLLDQVIAWGGALKTLRTLTEASKAA